MKKFLSLILLSGLFLSGCTKPRESLELAPELRLLSFVLEDTYEGVIDNHLGTVDVTVPKGTAIGLMTVTALSVPDGISCTMAVGDKADFSHPQTLTLSAGSVTMTFTVKVARDTSGEKEVSTDTWSNGSNYPLQ